MKRFLALIFTSALCLTTCHALRLPADVRFHCPEDTIVINNMLSDLRASDMSVGDAVLQTALRFRDLPYKGFTLEGEPEQLVVNVHEFDCVTFVQTVLALVKSSRRANPSWRDFAYTLENIRYRRGEMNGYPSRLHYTTDWVSDNLYRGNIREITDDLPGALSSKKSLDYMSRHAELYPALADSANLAAIKDVENGFRLHKMPYVKRETIGSKKVVEDLRSGDIIIFQSKEPGLDASHVGIIEIRNGKPFLVHASSVAGKVVEESRDLADYFKHSGRNAAGYRIIRLDL